MMLVRICWKEVNQNVTYWIIIKKVMTNGQYPFGLKKQTANAIHDAIKSKVEAIKTRSELQKRKEQHLDDLEKIVDIMQEIVKYESLDKESATKDELVEILENIAEIVMNHNWHIDQN